MAEKNTNANLYENADVGSLLDATQDDVVTTNENVNESVGEIAETEESCLLYTSRCV